KELLDSDGDILRNGGTYYILPALRGKGGGLELAKTGDETCPLNVVQARSETKRGRPAIIWTPPRIAILTPAFYLNIEFQTRDLPACLEEYSRLPWKVEGESQEVKIAPKEEEQHLFGSFKIKPYRDDYKLVYCEGNSDDDSCKDLGISIDDENNRLLVVKDGDPLAVRFVKAHRRG
uniref:Trypsin inhibitor n=1 Tax=Enterolobium contortisiliquum TaxID=55671 RepID=UPI00032D679B|nr:Chain A, Trypsin inhibitor [Enterolobium contortisiliquum]4J2K_B Chain B, Trypsin inhibitor [Enterolobium contortisiliquum]4J2Y_A Chain A, Trypsin inhibitor [Enterolobium contortisiliquum]